MGEAGEVLQPWHHGLGRGGWQALGSPCQQGPETHPERSRERLLLWGCDRRLDLGWQLGLGTLLDLLAASDSQKHPQKIHGKLRLKPSLEDGSVPLCVVTATAPSCPRVSSKAR